MHFAHFFQLRLYLFSAVHKILKIFFYDHKPMVFYAIPCQIFDQFLNVFGFVYVIQNKLDPNQVVSQPELVCLLLASEQNWVLKWMDYLDQMPV